MLYLIFMANTTELTFQISASEPWRAAAAAPRLATDIMISAPFTSSELSQSLSLTLLKLLVYEALS